MNNWQSNKPHIKKVNGSWTVTSWRIRLPGLLNIRFLLAELYCAEQNIKLEKEARK